MPEGLAAALEKAYARDRGHRYQSIAEFVLALAPYAPSRSQITIDSVAKMAGIASVMAGAPGAQRASLPSNVTVLLPENAYAQRPSAPSQPAFPGGSGAIHPGAVSAGPVSLQPLGVPKKSGAGLVIALGLAAVALVSVLGFFFPRSPGIAAPGGPEAASSGTGAPTSSGAVDAAPATTITVATAEPLPSAAASATTTPSTHVAGIATPPLPRQPGKPVIPVKVKPPKAGQPTDVGF